MPIQLRRLLLAFAIFIALFLVVRYFLVPDSYGELGAYRSLSLKENEEPIAKFVGVETCEMCHDTIVKAKASDVHQKLQCEVCHGPGYLHMENPETVKMIIPTEREHCGKCHELNAAKKSKIAQVNLAEHNVENKCIDCHNPHMPWELKE
ncbi:MAG: hypothetical protein A2033_03460 [Bacteroidetes bacterium GWA2_31_9]|nr:MAG: hypothetical protein A2033_03460 [Bacteroidetes bacterium GWA2_31_9]